MNLDFDLHRLRRLAPLGALLLVVVAGWMLLVSPTASSNAQAARAFDALRQRLVQAQVSLSEPPPAPPSTDPIAAFERQVAAGDASSQLLEQLARLATGASAANLDIQTGERVIVAAAGGPQVAGGALPDPRFVLFEVPLAYSPIIMSFDAQFARVGQFLWELRDPATLVEIRRVEIRPLAQDDRVHVMLLLFAYARQTVPAPAAGAAP